MRKAIDARRIVRPLEETDTDSEGSWAISYGDMVTLLLTFFILFFNVSQKPSEESKKVQAVLLTQLGAKSNDNATDKGKEEPKLDVGRKPDSLEIEEELVKTWGGKAHSFGNRILIEFPEKSFFDFGKTEVTKNGIELLSTFSTKYVPFAGSNVLSIKAFTDNVPVNKQRAKAEGRKYEDNLELSALRAVAAMRVLQKTGLPLNRMRISGYGESDAALRKLAAESPPPARAEKGNPLSRKIILLVEPVTKENL